MKRDVLIYETAMRDGLQGEGPGFIPTEKKLELGKKLAAANFGAIQVTSFAHPKWIPQLADAAEVAQKMQGLGLETMSVLVPNVKAAERAVECGVEEIEAVCSASESHSKSNLNKSVEEALDQVREIARIGKTHGIKVRGAISTSFGCPFEGKVDENQVIRIAVEMEKMGIYHVSLGDTTGMANPSQVYSLTTKLLNTLDTTSIALHFHQAAGIELANVYSGYLAGVRVFDGSSGGLGGCPYAKGALGNVDAVTMAKMFESMGVNTGVNIEKAEEAGIYANEICAEARGCNL